MASNYWIKLYHEILHDPKMGRLPDNLWRRVIECFLMAGELNEGGYLPPCGDMAWQLRLDDEALAAELEELAKLGVLELKDGRWFVVKFAERQAAMSSTERVQRYRKEQKKQTRSKKPKRQAAPPEPPENEPETPELPTRNESETIRSTDIDVDIDAESDEELPPTPQGGKVKEDELHRHWEEIADLAEVFTAETGIKPPSMRSDHGRKAVVDKWATPLWDMRQLSNGRTEQLIRSSVQEMDTKGLTIASPGSILSTFTRLCRQVKNPPPPGKPKDDTWQRLQDQLAEAEAE